MNRLTHAGIARLASIVFVLLFALPGIATAAAPTWTNPIANGTAGSPPAREYHTAVYDAAGNNMIVFGGCTNSVCPSNDVWMLSHANGSDVIAPAWTKLNPNQDPINGFPAARYLHTAVYDAAGNNLIVFGGCTNSACPSNDVWVLSHANNVGGTPTWTNITPAVSGPAARRAHTAVYDAAGNNLIVFGGQSNCAGGCVLFNDVWVLSHANNVGGTPTWTNITPAVSGPDARRFHTAVYDAAGNHMIVFGGATNTFGDVNDVWVLSHANNVGGTPAWTKLNPNQDPINGFPAGRFLHTAVYDAAGNNLIVFAGCANGTCPASDVWVLSNANGSVSGGTPGWTLRIADGLPTSPARREAHTAVYDAAGNHMIVFGGFVPGVPYVNDVWVLGNASPYTPPANIAANIDIRPNTAINTISLTTGTEVPVAILSSATFDATTQVDRTQLTFGKFGTETSFKSCNLRVSDVNADGYKDLVCHFDGTKGGFMLGDTVGNLQGMTTQGATISGSDSVVIIK